VFGIRRVYDAVLPTNKAAVAQVQDILRAQFPGIPGKELARLPDQMHNPLKYRFRSILFVAEGTKGKVRGFALVSHEPMEGFCFLDYLSTDRELTGKGIGGALYKRVREEALSLGTVGIFFECLPDDAKLCRNQAMLRQSIARLRFYERYGARPIANTAYETPVKPGEDCPPYLVFDNLGRGGGLGRDAARAIVRSILERKYSDVCPKSYVDMVVESFKDDPVRLRVPRYTRKEAPVLMTPSVPVDRQVVLTVNEDHGIHHVQERGYVEAPVRIGAILDEIAETGLFERVLARHYSEKYIRAVHDVRFVEYFKKVCANLATETSIYPYVFPIRNVARPPRDLAVRAGYYCIDTFTPLNRNAYLAAERAVDCALTAAERLAGGRRLAYALVRPPGHHAEKGSFGGFCYFNSGAIAAQYLCKYGRVAMLDIDFHHGNGQQDIFYERPDVFTVSIHGNPNFAYPYFSGFDDERGTGAGRGYNVNIPLPENVDGPRYRLALDHALKKVARFQPRFLVVALGLDTAREDPTGTWTLDADDFEANGKMIGLLRLPTLVVQEGGYDVRVLGMNARRFFEGLWSGAYAP